MANKTDGLVVLLEDMMTTLREIANDDSQAVFKHVDISETNSTNLEVMTKKVEI